MLHINYNILYILSHYQQQKSMAERFDDIGVSEIDTNAHGKFVE